MSHRPTDHTPAQSWRRPAQGPQFRAVQAALLQRGLRLFSATTVTERLAMGADYWVSEKGASRNEAVHEANSLEELCAWARCPLPRELTERTRDTA